MSTQPQYIFTVFSNAALFGGSLDFALTRSGSGSGTGYTYRVIHAKGYGFQASREERKFPALNDTPAPGRTIWLDGLPANDKLVPGGMLPALLALEPPVLRLTGRTRETDGAQEAEILLGEDELARTCGYCGLVESKMDDWRFEQVVDGEETLYWCKECPKVKPGSSTWSQWLRRLVGA